jgi:beta-galactosidase
MFSQGINPNGKGYYGKTFYYQTPLSENANKSPLYDSIKKINEFINREKEEFILSETKADICVGFYKPYFYTELTTSQLLKEKRLYIEKLGLTLDPRFVREEIFFNGLLRCLQTLNFNYDISDLEISNVENLLRYKQLWVVTTEFMDAGTQKLLAAYVKKGGHLIIYPIIPTLDLYLNPCSKLKDELEIEFEKSISPNKVDAFGIEDIYTVFKEKQIFQNISKTEIVSTTKTGEVCGIRKNIDDGIVTILGFAFGYTSDEHLHLIEKILSLDKIKRQIKVSDPDIQLVIRKSKKYSYLFLLNYHNQRKVFMANSKKYTIKPFSYKVVKMKL